MSGIAGAVGRFEPPEAEGIVQSMMLALAHRGPDDRGCESWPLGANTVAFGHTRLSTLDLSAAGHQPMTESTGRYWTVFDGQISNFQEIRRLLDPDARVFRTGTNSEAILHAYGRWSRDAFGIFRGMFAFALLDNESRTLHLVRDRLGIKPLYYYVSGERLLFASEVRALLACGQVPKQLDSEVVSRFLSFGRIGKAEIAIRGIQSLKPGQTLTVDLSGESLQGRISVWDRETERPCSWSDEDRSEATAHIFHLLEQSVKCHLPGDVPVGLFLSGGIGSSALLHLIRQVSGSPPKTFTVIFPEKDSADGEAARQLARRYDAEHHELELSESDLLAHLPAYLEAMDEPTIDGLTTFVIARFVREAGQKVALSGTGSEELFGGYASLDSARAARMEAKPGLEISSHMAGLLRDADSMSMASSLEVRVPFLDQAIVRHTLQLPGDWKAHRSKPKALLLEAMRGAVPDYVWRRPRVAFVCPFDRWMRSSLQAEVQDTLADAHLAKAAGLTPAAVSQVWGDFLQARLPWSKPWSLFVLMRWCVRNGASV